MSDSPGWLEELRQALATQFAGGAMVCTLATVDEHGMPAARCVVCRRIEPGGELLFVSDARSGKNEQLAERPAAEVVFWLPDQRTQYRLAGTVAIVRAGMIDALRLEVWKALSDQTRALPFWPAGGEPLDPDPSRFTRSVSADTEPPVTFELLILRPQRVDITDLRPHPHRRRIFTRGERGWTVAEVNP